MAYGIDDTIQQKVDAYRGNPAALQHDAQNRQLIDLLALQKLKSKKMRCSRHADEDAAAPNYCTAIRGRTGGAH